MSSFDIWITISIALLILATVLFVRSLVNKKESFWSSLKKWVVNIIDIFSGGP